MLLALIGLELVRLYVGYAPGPYVGKTFDRVFALGALLPNVLLVQALGAEPVDTWNVPSWSISCEAAVYLLFPFLYLCLSRSPRRIGPAMAGAGAVLLLGLYWIRQPHNLDASVDYGFVRCLAEFSLGICLYELAVRVRLPGVLGSGAAALAVLGAVVAAMHFDAPDLLLVPLFCLLILVAISNEGWFSRVLTSHPLQRLGDISYSIYLVHFPVLVAVDLAIYSATGVDPLGHLLPLPIRLGTLAGVIGLTLVFSSLTYRFIEVPCRKLIRGRRRSGAIRPRAKALPIAPAS
jgi:peptidoglycan/LPS O-acetylase OafA/YrhL